MRKHAALALAIAAVVCAPAFADGAVTSSTGASVSSGTGVTVTPGAPSASVAVTPSTTTVAAPSQRMLPGGTMVQQSSTTTMGGPAGEVSGSQTIVTRYWANVPAGAERRADFQRWQRLR
jgi:hypothetical protein